MAFHTNQRLSSRLQDRELGRLSVGPRSIYGDRRWVRDLDIVAELDGHAGCVNALSWSKSGRLLASGSDDVHLNIHSYQPEHSDQPFQLSTSISTGHTANIFSVKFMPHSNDRTLISAAGDSEIRIFDIEYAGKSRATSAASSRRTPASLGNVRFLSEGDTNAKVFRSHSDRVKRIVTESSPFLFLTCSEDGDVRQWDIRQPASAYPPPIGSRFSRGRGVDDSEPRPPPLISYKRHALDLNTISCSPSQPHYIALGGAHLHCFLHDRRMLGRDRLKERGQNLRPALPTYSYSGNEEDLLSEATQCVRRFAPQGQQRMKGSNNGHITACKISDANPNEMVASWSGDWIYNFDLIRSPDARSSGSRGAIDASKSSQSRKAKSSVDRKRKRMPARSALSQEGMARGGSRARTDSDLSGGEGSSSMALRVRYQNGQSEDIPMTDREGATDTAAPIAGSAANDTSIKIAKALVSIRKCMFTLSEKPQITSEDSIGYALPFGKVFNLSIAALLRMDNVMKDWRYPMDVTDVEINLQKTLRLNRDRARRFVQASAVIARTLGGRPYDSQTNDEAIRLAPYVRSSSLEKEIEDTREQFCYDFIKAICLWINSGINALVEGFSTDRPSRTSKRKPLHFDASAEDVDEQLIPYLLRLASNRAILNVDASKFEVDARRVVFTTEKAAVIAFSRAIKLPFADLSQAAVHVEGQNGGGETATSQDRVAAHRYWVLRVARGVLMNAGEGINFAFVDRAFGGLGRQTRGVLAEEQELERRHEDISDTEEAAIDSVSVSRASNAGDGLDSEEDMVGIDDVHDVIMAVRGAEGDDSNESDDSEAEQQDGSEGEEDDAQQDTSDGADEASDEDDDDDDDADFLFRSALAHGSQRRKVHEDVPCVTSQLHYSGAANTRTVKDVNFYGLQDDYVVSGSDSGHFFVWDRRSGQLLNILEGDGEVVNVVQGHPYEPVLAVSGIDHSIKIFGSDSRLRRNARNGIGTTQIDFVSTFSQPDPSLRVPPKLTARLQVKLELNPHGRPQRAPARPRRPPNAERHAPARHGHEHDSPCRLRRRPLLG